MLSSEKSMRGVDGRPACVLRDVFCSLCASRLLCSFRRLILTGDRLSSTSTSPGTPRAMCGGRWGLSGRSTWEEEGEEGKGQEV